MSLNKVWKVLVLTSSFCVWKRVSQVGYMSNSCAKTLIFNTGEILYLHMLSKNFLRSFFFFSFFFLFKDHLLTIYAGSAWVCVTTTLLLRNSRVTSAVECEFELFCCGEAELKGQRFCREALHSYLSRWLKPSSFPKSHTGCVGFTGVVGVPVRLSLSLSAQFCSMTTERAFWSEILTKYSPQNGKCQWPLLSWSSLSLSNHSIVLKLFCLLLNAGVLWGRLLERTGERIISGSWAGY